MAVPFRERIIGWRADTNVRYKGSSGMKMGSGCKISSPESDSGKYKVVLTALSTQGRDGASQIEIPMDCVLDVVAALLDANTAAQALPDSPVTMEQDKDSE
ncbi:MAG: hypothetical protein WCR85_00035 [Sphaerochaeta sp.]